MGFSFTFTPRTNNQNKSTTTATENWGMGLLLVFFPEDNNHHSPSPSPSPTTTTTTTSSSSSNHLFSSSRIKRSNSNLISSKAQSTISICALFVFFTLLLFTLSTFEPSTSLHTTPRRSLSQKSHPTNPIPNPNFSFLRMWTSHPKRTKQASPVALQGMGVLYRRGTRAVNDLVITHVADDTSLDEFRLFLRLLLRSGLSSKSDLAFLYASSSSLSKFGSVVQEENDSFLKLIKHYKQSNITRSKKNSLWRFDVTQFVKSCKKDMGEPLWGKRIRGNYSNSSESESHDQTESTQLSYGSLVGFEVNELDPENSLAGFLGHVIPMSLRRWACYPMLLGRVRRNFKHIMLVDVKKLVIPGDPLVRVRTQSAESVFISTKQEITSTKHGKKNSDKPQPHHQANSAILMGGARGVRRLSAAMLTEIVRASIQHKKKNSVTESGILSQLVANEHILKNINMITSTETIPEASSLTESRSSNPAVVMMQRGNSSHDTDYYSIITRQTCSCEAADSSVYKHC